MGHMNMDQGNQELDQLFQRYRAALPDPEASVNFMPELWRKIEARQFFLGRVKKLTQVFVAAAAAICLLLLPATISANTCRSRLERLA